MSEFIVFRENKSIGPAFNKAARILNDNKNITVLNTLNNLQMFVIEAPETAVANVKKSLPGWNLERNDRNFHAL